MSRTNFSTTATASNNSSESRTNTKPREIISGYQAHCRTGGGDWILAFLVSGCLLAFLIPAAFSVEEWRSGNTAEAKQVSSHQSVRRQRIDSVARAPSIQ